ncbi:S-layer homology domain-containing protein [Paenibacillus sp. JDR-2]|uniref:S-layer homology domain-containing protein n=1 Tax=Paenibacillus sp. (strain JDR-2) TaxID=324057 RepID=UPI0001AAF8CB|nr:S-layer homology domain-containing protein [Paenibacillus sp. JDR-2]ACT01198.1 S-layer domain protein [Paenibacillus sp. JDR-2]
MRRNRKWLSTVFAFVLLIQGFSSMATPSIQASPAEETEQPWEWNSVNLQGMGWVTGLVTQKTAPYLMYAKTDVGGVYRYVREEDRWEPLSDWLSLDNRHGYAVESIAIDPGAADDVYMAVNGSYSKGGEIYASHNRGETWAATGMGANDIYMGGNDALRSETGERLAVDPNRSGSLYFASRGDGLWTKKGNAAWSKLTGGLPNTPTCQDKAGCGGFSFVAFDKNSGTTASGDTKIFYVGVYEDGVYKTIDGGISFAKLGGPTGSESNHFFRAAVNASGTLLVTSGQTILRAERTDSVLAKVFDSNDHSEIVQKTVVGIDMDPSNASLFYAQAGDSDAGNAWMYVSSDGGLTWSLKQEHKGIEPEYYPEWWSNHERAPLVVDPIDPTTAWTSTGFGILKIRGINTDTPVADANMHGIEELVGYIAKVPPLAGGFDVHVGSADSAGFSVRDRNTVPDTRLMGQKYDGPPMWGINLTQMSGLDYSYQNPNEMAYMGYHQFALWNGAPFNFYGTTHDGGRTWEESAIPSTLETTGGMIAMSSTTPSRMIWSPYNGYMKYSEDGGKTWKDASGIESQVFGHLYERNSYWWSSTQNLASDKVNGSKFYMFTEKDSKIAQFYMSEDSGKTWKNTYTGYEAQGDEDYTASNPEHKVNFAALPFVKVKVNPAKEGDVFLASKQGDFGDDHAGKYSKLYRSADASVTDFTEVPNVQAAVDVAFGKGDSPDQPYIYLYGIANGDSTSGVYVSKDNAKSWQKITDASHSFGGTNSIEADMRYKDRVYLSLEGRGFVYGQPAGLPEVSISGIQSDEELPNAVQAGRVYKAGASVAIQAEAAAASGSSISKVEFFEGDRKLGEDTTAPYSLQIEADLPGDYYMIAKATDSQGRVQYSSPQDFSVRDLTEVTGISYKNEAGQPLTALTGGQTIKVETSVQNNTGIAQQVNLVAALEDGQANPVKLVKTTASLKANGKAVLGAELKLPEAVDGHIVKVYVWDNGQSAGKPAISTIPDTTAPSWPKTAKLYYTERGETNVKLYWANATDDFAVSRYEVYQDGVAAPIATVDGNAVRQFTVTNLDPNTEYAYRVVAVDGEGTASETLGPVQLRTLAADAEAPSVPTNLHVSNVTSQSAVISWSAATDNVGVTGYDVYAGDSKQATVTGTSYTATGLTPDTLYSFRVAARDARGNESAKSTAVEARTSKQPQTGTGTTNVSDPTVKGGTIHTVPSMDGTHAAINLKAQTISDAIQGAVKDKKDAISIETAASTGKFDSLDLDIPAASVLEAKQQGINRIRIVTPFFTLTLSTDAIAGLHADDQTIKLQISKLAASDSAGKLVYDFNLLVDGTAVHTFNGYHPVKAEIPYNLQSGQKPGTVIASYVGDGGKLEPVKNSRYDALSGMLVFYPPHFSQYAITAASPTFTDAGSVKWAQEAIDGLAARQIVNGVQEGHFAPQNKVTRAEFISMLVRTFDLLQPSAVSSFTDVKQGAWYEHEVASAEKLGIVKGYSDGSFGVNRTITREEMAAMIWNAANAFGLKPSTGIPATGYTDEASISSYAKEAVLQLSGAGLLNGYENGSFMPSGNATRAEAAVLIYRILQAAN